MKKGNEIITIKFIGEDLHKNAIPIYDLGNVFIGMQRIINQFYKEKVDGKFTNEKRKECAFQFGRHSKSSDVYELISYVQDNPILTLVISNSLVEMSKWIGKKLSDCDKDDNGSQNNNTNTTTAATNNDIDNSMNKICNSIKQNGMVNNIEINHNNQKINIPIEINININIIRRKNNEK